MADHDHDLDGLLFSPWNLTDNNCRVYIADGNLPEGDPDISGIGVILGFLISAYITLASVLFAYAFGFIEASALNAIDKRIFGVKAYDAKHSQWHAALRKAVLALSDQQIVVGIAILGAGFEGLRNGEISVYHFQIVLYLAWMSSSVHLSAMTLLRPYLNLHLGIKTWRLVGMLTLFVMLLVGFIPTISNDWGLISPWNDNSNAGRSGWAIPAQCFWLRTYGDGVNPDAPIGLTLLIISYLWKIGDLFQFPRDVYGAWIRHPIDQMLENVMYVPAKRYMRTRNTFWLWLFRFFLLFYLQATALMECISSFSGSLWVSTLGVVFGTIQIAIPRAQNIDSTGVKENHWGFGQLMPLILLIAPIGAITEVVWIKGGRPASMAVLDPTDLSIIPSWSLTSSSTDSLSSYSADPKEPLISIISSSKPTCILPPTSTKTKTTAKQIAFRLKKRQNYLIDSRLFQLQVWLLQFEIGILGALIFFFDYETIGQQQSISYIVFVWGVAASIALSAGVVLILCPWSRVGRGMSDKIDQNSDGEKGYQGYGGPKTPNDSGLSSHSDSAAASAYNSTAIMFVRQETTLPLFVDSLSPQSIPHDWEQVNRETTSTAAVTQQRSDDETETETAREATLTRPTIERNPSVGFEGLAPTTPPRLSTSSTSMVEGERQGMNRHSVPVSPFTVSAKRDWV